MPKRKAEPKDWYGVFPAKQIKAILKEKDPNRRVKQEYVEQIGAASGQFLQDLVDAAATKEGTLVDVKDLQRVIASDDRFALLRGLSLEPEEPIAPSKRKKKSKKKQPVDIQGVEDIVQQAAMVETTPKQIIQDDEDYD